MSEVLYRVEAPDSEQLGFPVELDRAVEQVRKRAPSERTGALRIVRVEYELDPDGPPTIATKAQREVWRGTVVKFPDVGTMGTYVCKDGSQHRYGNAGDWAAAKAAKTTEAIIAYLWKVARWQRAQGVRFEKTRGREGLPVSEVIFRDRIATRLQGWTWRSYGGVLHAVHVHDSAYLLIATSRPCGKVA